MIYADSAFLVAFRVPQDTFHQSAIDFYEIEQDQVWLWSPWHRIEVFNAIRQLARHPQSRRPVSAAQARATINRIEQDVRVGYFTHMEADWRDVLRTASEISLAHGFALACRSADLLHVAYAKELSAEHFVSFDKDQLRLAKAAGLKAVQPS